MTHQSIVYTRLFAKVVALLARTHGVKRNNPALSKQLYSQLRDNKTIVLPSSGKSFSEASLKNWINNIKLGRYTYSHAVKGLRCGRTGAGGR